MGHFLYQVILLIYLLLLLFLAKKSNHNKSGAIVLMIAWWMGWYTLSSTDHWGIFFSDAHVGQLVIAFSFSLVLGAAFQNLLVKHSVGSIQDYQFNFGKLSKIILIVLIPLLLISIYVFGRSLSLVLINHFSFAGVRRLFFTFSDAEGNFWFKSKLLWTLFLIISGVVFHFLLVVSIPLFITKKNKLLFILFSIFVFLETVARMSRGLVYSIVLCFSFVFYMMYSEDRFSAKIKSFIFGALGLVVVMCAVSIMRDGNPLTALVYYHTIGFSLLSKLINHDFYFNSSHLSWGRMTLGGFDYLFAIVFRGLGDKAFQIPAYYNTFLENAIIPLGPVSKSDMSITSYNSYYTMLSSLYLDLGSIGVCLLGAVIGFFTTKFEFLYRKNNDVMALIWLLFIFYNCIMGIFGAVFETPGFWLTFIGLIVFTNYVNFYRIESASEV